MFITITDLAGYKVFLLIASTVTAKSVLPNAIYLG